MARTMPAVDHYENFPVASWLCPPHLRGAVVALYHFARTADDLADEGPADAEQRLAQLGAYRRALEQASDPHSSPVHAKHPRNGTSEPLAKPWPTAQLDWPEVFGPLAQHIRAHALPLGLLHALLDAFEQDVRYTQQGRRYASRAELLDYCAKSANPIGRLLLHLYRINDAAALAMSDAVCSSLQLINFWQDLSEDLPRGRLYLPNGADLSAELAYARALMQQGAPLVHRVPGRAGWELRLVVQGGLRILDKIERTDPWLERPTLVWHDWVIMLWRALWMRAQ
jgi:squalene synthase HpnC